MKTMTLCALAVALVGCGKKTEQTKPADPAAAAPEAPAATAGVADAQPAAAPATPSFLPAAIDEKSGIVFAEKAGGLVEGIKDGTPVAVVAEKDGMVGDEEDASVTIEHGGKKVELKTDRVLRGGTLDGIHRSADGKYAVFSPVVGCGDICHSVLWLIRTADGQRVLIGEGGPDVHVAWHPDGSTVAVGSGSLWVVSLADYKATPMEGYLSPSYAPDGTLYVRNHDGSAFTVGKGKPVRVWKAPKREAMEDDEGMPSEDPTPVEFADGKPKFDLDDFPH